MLFSTSHLEHLYLVLPWVWLFVPVYLLYCSCIYPFYLSPLRKIPTVPGFPLWGHSFTLATAEAGVPQRLWHEKHGPVIRIFLPLGIELLSIADSEAIKQITVRNPYNYPYPPRVKRFLSSILGNGLLVSQGESHSFLRKALAPSFSTSSVMTLSPIFWRRGLLLSRLWLQEVEREDSGKVSVEVLDWMNRGTLDIIGEAAFGYSIDSLQDNKAPFRVAYLGVFNTDMHLLQVCRFWFPALKYLPLKVNRDIQNARRMIRDEANAVVNSKRNIDPDNAGTDVLSSIIREADERSDMNQQTTARSLRDQVRTFVGAGHDTTSTAVCWALLQLAKSPDIQQRIRCEIREYMPSLFDKKKRHDVESLVHPDRLPYLDNFCRESLRHVPPIALTIRESVLAEQLAGYEIPPHTLICISINAINRLTKYWGEDANTFDPDRWDKPLNLDTTNAFMTFSQGPKGCIARKFAEMELKILLCCLLSAFSFEQDMDWEDPLNQIRWKVVLRPQDGIHLKLEALT